MKPPVENLNSLCICRNPPRNSEVKIFASELREKYSTPLLYTNSFCQSVVQRQRISNCHKFPIFAGHDRDMVCGFGNPCSKTFGETYDVWSPTRIEVTPFEKFWLGKKEVARTGWSNVDQRPPKVPCKQCSFDACCVSTIKVNLTSNYK